jgi:hypothetical protein
MSGRQPQTLSCYWDNVIVALIATDAEIEIQSPIRKSGANRRQLKKHWVESDIGRSKALLTYFKLNATLINKDLNHMNLICSYAVND